MSEFNPSNNRVSPMIGVTNDANLTPQALRVDATTKRLLVDAGTITTTSASVGATAAAIPASADFIGGSDGTNLRGLLVESATQFNLRTVLYSGATKLIGQTTMAGSIPIVVASDQTALPTTLGAAITAGDSASNPTTAPVNSFGHIFWSGNGNWNRMRQMENGTNLAGSVANGIIQSGLMAQFDDVSPNAITENQFGNVRMSTNRNVYQTIRDAAGNERGANVDANSNLGVVLAAETTKVLGVTRTADGAGNLLTSTAQALDVNIKSEAAPAISTTRVAIAASSSGDNTLIAAVSAKKIYVVAFELSFAGTVNAKFTDGAAGTNLGGLYYGIANAGAANSMSPDMKLAIPSPYLFVGSTNTALILNLSAAIAVGGAITYFTV